MMKKAKDSSVVFNSLRSYAKHRILNDMIDTARRHAQDKEYMIMILDHAALRVFSSCCKFFDVYKANLYHIERLEIKRKRFPHTDALYFISPTQESIGHLLRDFSDENIDGDKKPAPYGGVHLCFTSRVSYELLKRIATCRHLTPRVLSFNEINLDFFLFNDNVFHLSRRNILPAFKLADESTAGVESGPIQRLLDEMCHRLFTVCSVFMECPWVQYQGSSPLAKALAAKINEQLTRFYTQAQQSQQAQLSKSQIKIREPRGTLLILDRGFDLVAPVIHDFFYQSLVYEFAEVGEEGEVQINESKMAFLNDQDELWVRLRNKHVAEVHAVLNREVSAVAAESKRKAGTSADEMSLSEMAEVIRAMPKYEEMMKRYQVHMELINKSITEFTANSLRKLIALEQDIISGVDSKGNKVNNTTLVKEMSQLSKSLREQDYLRLLMIYFACFDLNRKDRDTLLKSVPSDAHRSVLENLEYLDAQMVAGDAGKFRRRRDELSSETYNEYARKLSQSEYEILRTEPLICQLIKQVHDGTIDTKRFPFLKEKTQTKKQGKGDSRRKGASNFGSEFDRQDVVENPRIFVFVIGGLSHHEIVSIANLQESLNAQVIPGANEIIKTKDFLHQLEKLHKKENDLAFIKNSDSKPSSGVKGKKGGNTTVDVEEEEDGQDFLDTDGGNHYTINM